MELRYSFELAASAADVWQVLGERFGDVAEWASGLDSSSQTGELGVGCVRVCESPAQWPFPAGTVKERLELFDRDGREFAYRAFEGLPGMLSSAGNRWRVESIDGGRCRVHMHATLELSPMAKVFSPLLRLMLGRMGKQFAEDLRQHVEGRPAPELSGA